MISSRNTFDLLPTVGVKVRRFVELCEARGVPVLVTCTYRDNAEQARLYAQGRTTPGAKVTNAKPGESWHNWRCAVDVVPMRNGKPVWGTKGDDLTLWAKVGAIGEECGLEWAGRWVKFREFPHFQYTGGLSLADIRAGKVPK